MVQSRRYGVDGSERRTLPDGGCTMATTAPTTTDHRLGFRSQESELDLAELPVRGEVPAGWEARSCARARRSTRRGREPSTTSSTARRCSTASASPSGRVSYRNRFLQTKALRKVREEGRIGLSEFATDPCRSIFGSRHVEVHAAGADRQRQRQRHPARRRGPGDDARRRCPSSSTPRRWRPRASPTGRRTSPACTSARTRTTTRSATSSSATRSRSGRAAPTACGR